MPGTRKIDQPWLLRWESRLAGELPVFVMHKTRVWPLSHAELDQACAAVMP
jgi:hypothetical protein